MVTIQLKNKNGNEYEVYTEEEAKERGLEYTYWKDGKEGDLVISDDKYVSKLLKRKIYYGKKNKYLHVELYKVPYRELFVTTYINKKGEIKVYNPKMIAEPFLKEGIYHHKKVPITWEQSIFQNPSYMLLIEIYYDLLKNCKLTNQTEKMLGKMFFGGRYYLKKTLCILKNKGVQKYMREKLENDLKNMGIENPSTYGLELLKKAAEIGLESKDASVLIKVAREINTLFDVYPKKIVTEQKFLAESVREITEADIVKESKLIELQRKNTE